VVTAGRDDETLDGTCDDDAGSEMPRFFHTADGTYERTGEESLGSGSNNFGVYPVVRVGDPEARSYVVKLVHRAGPERKDGILRAAHREREICEQAVMQDRYLLAPLEDWHLPDDPAHDAFLVYPRYACSLRDALKDPDLQVNGIPADVCLRLVGDVAVACERMRTLTARLSAPMVAHADIAPANILLSVHHPDHTRALLDPRTQFVLTDAGSSPTDSVEPAVDADDGPKGHERYCPRDRGLHRSLDAGRLGLVLVHHARRSGAAPVPGRPDRLTAADLATYPVELRPTLAALTVPAVVTLQRELELQLDTLASGADGRAALGERLDRAREFPDLRRRTNPLRAPLWAAAILAEVGRDLAADPAVRLAPAGPLLDRLVDGEWPPDGLRLDTARRKAIRQGRAAGRDSDDRLRWELAAALLGQRDIDLPTLLAEVATVTPDATDDRVWGFVIAAAAAAPVAEPDGVRGVRWPQPLWRELVAVAATVAVVMAAAVAIVAQPTVRSSLASATASVVGLAPFADPVDPHRPPVADLAGPVRSVVGVRDGRASATVAWTAGETVDHRLELDPGAGPLEVEFDSDLLEVRGVSALDEGGTVQPVSATSSGNLGVTPEDTRRLSLQLRPVATAPAGLLEGTVRLLAQDGSAWAVPIRYGHADSRDSADPTAAQREGAWFGWPGTRHWYAEGVEADELGADDTAFNHSDEWLAGWESTPRWPIRVLEPTAWHDWSPRSRMIGSGGAPMMVAYLVHHTGQHDGPVTLSVGTEPTSPAFGPDVRIRLTTPGAATSSTLSSVRLHADVPIRLVPEPGTAVQLMTLEEYVEDPVRTDRPWFELGDELTTGDPVTLPADLAEPHVVTLTLRAEASPLPTTSPPTSRDELEVGDCLVFTSSPVDLAGAVPVDCASPHHAQVFTAITLPEQDADPPALVSTSEERCVNAVRQIVADPSDHYGSIGEYVNAYPPDRVGWADGDRRLLCTIFEPRHRTVEDGAILERETFS
jgi:hypothetical protein